MWLNDKLWKPWIFCNLKVVSYTVLQYKPLVVTVFLKWTKFIKQHTLHELRNLDNIIYSNRTVIKYTLLTTIIEGDHNTLYSQCDTLIFSCKTSVYIQGPNKWLWNYHELCNATLSWKHCVHLWQHHMYDQFRTTWTTSLSLRYMLTYN